MNLVAGGALGVVLQLRYAVISSVQGEPREASRDCNEGQLAGGVLRLIHCVAQGAPSPAVSFRA